MTTNKSNLFSTLSERLRNDETGFVVSAELLLIMTMLICSVAVGFSTVKDAIATELGDISDAIGAVDQSYSVAGYATPTNQAGVDHGRCSAFGFQDREDTCDCQPIEIAGVAPKVDDGNGAENL